MRRVVLEDFISETILYFCENLAELGCPREAEPDMWYRELSDEERYKVSEKLLNIMERPPIGEDKMEDIKRIHKVHEEGNLQTLCGVRFPKATTLSDDLVTCFDCKRIIKRENIKRENIKRENIKRKKEKEPEEKIIQMVEMEIDIEDCVLEKIVKYALEEIKNDRAALVNYGINKILKNIVDTDGKCLGE